MMHIKINPLWGLLCLSLAACGGDDDTSSTDAMVGGGGSGGTPGADAGGAGATGGGGGGSAVTFAEVFSTVGMGARCSGPLCHTSAVGGELVMTTADTAYDNLVDQPAAGVPCADSGLLRVDPGNPEESLLYLKLSDAPPCGDPMPVAGALQADQIELVYQWIADGALKE